MNHISTEQFNKIVKDYGDVIPGLKETLGDNIKKEFAVENSSIHDVSLSDIGMETVRIIANERGTVASERIIVAKAGARPVARIKNDKATTEFLGKNTSNSPWTSVIVQASDQLNKAIPAVGRIELSNGEMEWVGTGWLIDEGILVTNAHVAEEFSRLDSETSSFVFKPGLLGGFVSSNIDFLEEENNTDSIEHPITSVLWIAPPGETDVAFLKVTQANGKPALPAPVDLGDSIEKGTAIAAIGYPARDESIRDQVLVISIFGDEVYDKKRLSPGQVTLIDGDRLHHDCSTLGGNSGSLLIDLKSGKAIGLHQGGFLDDSANLGVTISHLKKLLAAVKQNLNNPERGNIQNPLIINAKPDMEQKNELGEIKISLQIPLEVSIKMGQITSIAAATTSSNITSPIGTIDAALEAAKKALLPLPDVIRVRKGYRFSNGWITDERVIVVELKEKLPFGVLVRSGKKPLPREIMGVGIDVRTAALPDQLESMGIDLTVLERKGKAAGYKEPPGFDDENSDMFLGRIKEKMDAIFHVSPDAGFKNLSAFIGRIKKQLTATIYEWEANHISDALEDAMQGVGKSLTMVTQRTGVGESDATISAVENMQQRIGDKFNHVWASARGPKRLIPDSYHIKVASRDGEEVWLSSGNWKESNQPKNATSFTALKKFNREWHAIIKNDRIAKLFQRYIEYDFEQAQKFPTLISESLQFHEFEFFIPESAFVGVERIANVTYKDELKIEDEILDIHPLLTPDLDAEGDHLFLKQATNMIRRATKKYLYTESVIQYD